MNVKYQGHRKIKMQPGNYATTMQVNNACFCFLFNTKVYPAKVAWFTC